MAPGSISSKASSPSSHVRSCATSASPPNTSSRSASWPPSTTSTKTPSFTRGHTSSIGPPDMIRISETLDGQVGIQLSDKAHQSAGEANPFVRLKPAGSGDQKPNELMHGVGLAPSLPREAIHPSNRLWLTDYG